MRRPPTSALLATRDLAALAAAAFGLSLVVAALAERHNLAVLAGYDDETVSFTWGPPLGMARVWTGQVLGYAAVVWCATRARAGERTAWLPCAVATSGALAVSAVTLVLVPTRPWDVFWPWFDAPFRWHPDGSLALDPTHPTWAFPPLVVALLVTAAWLGSRAGRRADDPLARRVVAPERGGAALAAVVVGLPALGGTAGALVAHVSAGYPPPVAGDSAWTAAEAALPLVLAVAAAALLSGTGRLGVLATLLAAAPAVVAPLSAWFGARAGGAALAEAAACGLVVLVVAVWRPCAVWACEVLAGVRAPAHRPGA